MFARIDRMTRWRQGVKERQKRYHEARDYAGKVV